MVCSWINTICILSTLNNIKNYKLEYHLGWIICKCDAGVFERIVVRIQWPLISTDLSVPEWICEWVGEWFTYSLIKQTCSFLNEFSVIEQLFNTIPLNSIQDSNNHLRRMVCNWAPDVFEQIGLVNDSMAHSWRQTCPFVSESVFLNKSRKKMIHLLTHYERLVHSWMKQCFWTNWFEWMIQWLTHKTVTLRLLLAYQWTTFTWTQ